MIVAVAHDNVERSPVELSEEFGTAIENTLEALSP